MTPPGHVCCPFSAAAELLCAACRPLQSLGAAYVALRCLDGLFGGVQAQR